MLWLLNPVKHGTGHFLPWQKQRPLLDQIFSADFFFKNFQTELMKIEITRIILTPCLVSSLSCSLVALKISIFSCFHIPCQTAKLWTYIALPDRVKGYFWSVAKVALRFRCAKQSKNLEWYLMASYTMAMLLRRGCFLYCHSKAHNYFNIKATIKTTKQDIIYGLKRLDF